MASDYDDDDRRDDDRRDDRYDDDAREKGRKKASTPAVFLIVAGLIGVLLEFGTIGMIVTKPTVIYDLMVQMVENQPPGPEKQKQLDDLKAQEAGMRLDSPMNVGSAVLGTILGILVVVGGISMKNGSSYGLAMTGAICSIIPIGGCCCIGMPVGIWALIVLLKPEVKASFGAVAKGAGEY